MSSIRVEVTQQDITLGEPAEATSCPVALAMRRTFPKADPWVGIVDAELHESYPDISLPDEAIAFIERFDRNDDVKPFSFEIEVRDELLAEIRP